MRFSQTATRYHFLLNSNGGVIQVQTKDPADLTNRNDITVRLGHIAKALGSGDFAKALGSGDFGIPILVHTDRPEVQEMKHKSRIIANLPSFLTTWCSIAKGAPIEQPC